MSPQNLHTALKPLASEIADRPLGPDLEAWLNQNHGPSSSLYRELVEICRTGVSEAWLCQREAGGIKYGRVFKPDAGLSGFSVDVVDMENMAGPHHTHPLGEIDLLMPLEGEARFDDHPAGWVVYPPGSAHFPTVSLGRALVLYLLPQGKIEFTPS